LNYRRYVPIICIVGAFIGFFAATQLWIHAVEGFPSIMNVTGLDLMNSEYDGFQKYIPVIVIVLSAISIVTSASAMISPRLWFCAFISLILGAAIMVVTSIFTMWVIDGEKAVHFADIGLWLSYLAGTVIIFGVAIQYSTLFVKTKNAGRR